MPTTLDQILASTRRGLPALHARRDALVTAARARPRPPFFGAALRGDAVALIGEVKRRSPSQGTINAALDPAGRAAAYADAGAAAISVLTDADHFGGSIDDLRAVAARVHVPLLRKDFILDEAQIDRKSVV